MGGNLFEGSSRLSTEDYHKLYRRFSESSLRSHCIDFELTSSYSSKSSHGDMDIVICGVEDSFYSILEEEFKPTASSFNGNVKSYLIDGFQVDFIIVSEEEFDNALLYYSFNDLGNLLGRITKYYGFTWGHKGLIHEKSKLLVSLYPEEIFRFFNFKDPFFYENELITLNDLFEFVESFTLFDPRFYVWQNRNHEGRHRDKKRDNYVKFLSKLEETYKNVIKDPLPPCNKELWLLKALNFFPAFQQRYFQYQYQQEDKKLISQKFNGNIVSELTELKGAELGKLMKYLKSKDNFDKFILESDEKTIENWIKESLTQI